MIRKNILVTGGGGFLGSHLCERLLNDGHNVICADNFFTGCKRNIEHLLDNHRFEVLRHDVTFPLYVEVDEIYNLACPASPIHYQRDPVQTVKTCVHGAINMLGLAKRIGAKILQSSTSEGKRAAETLFMSYYRQCRLRIKIVRIFNTYGPNMHPNDGRVVSNFILQALRGEPITIYGDGSQTRSFCYCTDLIDAMVRMMNTGDEVTGPINIGNPGEFTMLQLAELVRKLTNSNSEIVFRPLPSDDPRQRRPDITKAQQILGWKPTTHLEEGLKLTIRYFDDLLRSGEA